MSGKNVEDTDIVRTRLELTCRRSYTSPGLDWKHSSGWTQERVFGDVAKPVSSPLLVFSRPAPSARARLQDLMAILPRGIPCAGFL